MTDFRFERDGSRFIAYFGEARIGFVSRVARGRWEGTDTVMERDFSGVSREEVAQKLLVRFNELKKSGEI